MSKTEIDIRFTFRVFDDERDKADELYAEIQDLIKEKFDNHGEPELVANYLLKQAVKKQK